MKLSYRGVTYDYNPPAVNTKNGQSDGQVGGKYRGLDWRFRNLEEPPVLQPRVNLKYRGVSYQIGGTQADKSAETEKVAAGTTQAKARWLMLDRLRTLRNRQQTMLNRSAEEVGMAVRHS